MIRFIASTCGVSLAYVCALGGLRLARPVFTVGRATSTDGGVQWSAPKTVWGSDEARLPPSPPLSLKQFTALSSCSLLELRYSERGLESKTHRVGPKFRPASGLIGSSSRNSEPTLRILG